MLAILSAFSMLVGIASSLENRGVTPLQASGCPEVYNLVIPNQGSQPIDYIGHNDYGCMYSLELIVDGRTINAVAKTPWAPNEPISEGEIKGLNAVDQYITHFIRSGRGWVIMNLHLQLGVPLKETRGWRQFGPSDLYPTSRGIEDCVYYLMMVSEAYTTEIQRVAKTYKVHNKIRDLDIVVFQENRSEEDRLVGMTARIVNWNSYEVFSWNSREEISREAAKLAQSDREYIEFQPAGGLSYMARMCDP